MTVLHYAPDELWSWLGTLVATAVAALLAVAFGLHLLRRENEEADRQAEEQENRRRYRYNPALDAELENILVRLDPDKSETVGPFRVRLPSTRIASAVVNPIEPVMLVESPRSALLETINAYTFLYGANSIRTYNQASSMYLDLYHSLLLAPAITMEQEEAVLDTARIAEERRKNVIGNCESLRSSLQDWFSRNEHAKPT